jgi:hypothetical protein
MTSKRLVAE